MNLIILISIIIRFIAMMWSIFLLRQLRDWRMAFLSLMLGLMATRQLLTLVHDFHGWTLILADHQEELFGLIVSILSMVMVICLQKIITELKNKDLSLKEKEISLSTYQDYFNAATSSIFIFNENKKLIDINPAACAMQGYTREEMLTMDPTEYIHPDYHQRFHDFFSTIELNKTINFYSKGIKKDRSIIHVDVTGTLFTVDEKRFYLASLIDLTEQHNAEIALRESEDRLKLVLDGSQDGHWDWDILEDNGWWSAQFYHLLGYEDGELPPTYESFFFLLHPDDKERMLQKQNDHLKNKKPYDIEYRLLKKSGEYGWFHARGQAQWDEQGNAIRMGGSIQDITERIEAEKKLHEQERQAATLISNLPGVVYRCRNDADWTVEFIDGSVYELTGYSANEFLIGKKHWGDIIHVDDQAYVWNEIQLANSEKRPFTIEYRIIASDKKEKWVWEQGRAIFNEADTLLALEGFITETSERKMAEKAFIESEEKYRSIVETTSEWIWECDLNGNHIYSNNAIMSILGYSSDEIVGKSVYELIHPDFLGELTAGFEQAKKNKTGWHGFVISWLHKDGSVRYLESNAYPVFDNNGQLKGYRGADRDITRRIRAESERKQAEEFIRASESRYRTLYDNNPSMFFTINQNFIVISVNYSGADQLGYKTHELIGHLVLDVFFEKDKTRALNFLNACLAEPEKLHRWELRKVRKDGSMLWVRETARVSYDSTGYPMIFITCEDISETHLLSEQLTYQASHDVLTGLINRREFEIRLNRILDTTQMQQSEHALCYLDLDEFKVINDTCGHIAGDELLRDISSVLQKRIRKRDTLARLGGDEFGILMEHCDMAHAKKVAKTILQEIGDYRFAWDDRSFKVGVSIGLVPINQSISEYTEILRAADAACYVAKDTGRNRIHIYSEDDIDLVRRHGEMQWVSRINKALEKNHFLLYAQAIVPIDKDKKKKKHYELLIRLQEGPTTDIIAPGIFLPAAERYNLATALDKWVVETVFQFLKDQPKILSDSGLFSINLSGKSLANDDFLDFIMIELNQTPEIANKICFEITETAVIANLNRATLFIRRLKELGCQFALDDFGSGLSSFAYLKTLPVDYLKIDGMFVKDIVEDETDFAMVKSINDIGQVMGIHTIAEFVENNQIKQKLIDIGVNFAQGYGIGKPVPLTDLINNDRKKPGKKATIKKIQTRRHP